MIKKIIAGLCAVLLISTTAFAEGETIDCTKLTEKPAYFNDEYYLPLLETFENCGVYLSWDNRKRAYYSLADTAVTVPINSTKMIVDGEEREFENPTLLRNNRVYLPLSTLKKLFPEYTFELSNKNINLSIGDDFRYESAERYQNWFICNDEFVFAKYLVTEKGAREYADIVNSLAEGLEGVRIFDMLVPEASEFYAPKGYVTNQVGGFELVFKSLSDKVIAVDVVSELYRHANEKIYFGTDHHWTQRGAYYGYSAFLNMAGGSIDAISSFDCNDNYSYKGSYANSGCDIGKLELMERFMPKGENVGYVYSDSTVSSDKHEIKIINTDDMTYACFMGGDNALCELKGNVNNGKKLCIVKESFGNSMAVWAVNNYETVYVVDIRKFDSTISKLHEDTSFDDLLIESYAEAVGSRDLREYLKNIAK